MSRTPIVVGNWKCHKTVAEALALVTELKHGLARARGVEVGVAPPFTALHAVGKRLEDSAIALCAQDCHFEDRGAFTGEVSAPMLAEVGCRYAIVGHSERRQLFGEDDATVARKLQAALRAGLRPILCVGETLAERDAGAALPRLRAQVRAALEPVAAEAAERVVVAYEPVWAIGTGRTASPGQAQEAHAYIRELLRERWGALAERVRIQYGGSVKPESVAALAGQPEVDGFLVGGASLAAADFLAIAHGLAPRAARAGD